MALQAIPHGRAARALVGEEPVPAIDQGRKGGRGDQQGDGGELDGWERRGCGGVLEEV